VRAVRDLSRAVTGAPRVGNRLFGAALQNHWFGGTLEIVMSVPKLEVIPGRGIDPIRLGMTPDEVESALLAIGCRDLDQAGLPDFERAFCNSVQVNYDAKSKRCSRVGIYWHPGCGCECFFHGKHISEYAAEDLFALLAQLEGNDREFRRQQGFVFPRIRVQLHDLSTAHDYRENGKRVVYGEIAVGDLPWPGFGAE
jgi:hypothetical protein